MTSETLKYILGYGQLDGPDNPAVHPNAIAVTLSEMPHYVGSLTPHGQELWHKLYKWQTTDATARNWRNN